MRQQESKMTKTNINLIVNGTKAYTRKTTGRPYTHALVMHRDGKWSIMSCSSKGPAPLQSIINGAAEYRNYLAARIANEPGSVYVDSWRSSVAFADAAEYRIVAIIDNTITVNA
jgi:hypothetical protein